MAETMEKDSSTAYWLSAQQKLIWLSQSEGSSWNSVCLVLLEGPLQEDRLHAALDQVLQRHEVLRTVYRRPAGMKTAFQIVLPTGSSAWESVDLRGVAADAQERRLEELFETARARRIDLEQGPIAHACWVRLDAGRAGLVLGLPALAGDVLSWNAAVRELGLSYAQMADVAEEPFRYAQFAQWQNDLLETDDEHANSAKDYWNRQRSAVPLTLPQELPGDSAFRPESANLTMTGAFTMEVLLAAWQTLLGRLSGQTHFHTGVFFGGREYEELANAPGLVGKFLPLAARFDGDYSFDEVVAHVRDERERATEWQEYFNPESHLDDQVTTAFEYLELLPREDYAGVAFTVARQEACTQRFSCRLAVHRQGEAIELRWHYDAARLTRETVEGWSRYYRTLLLAAGENSQTAASRLPLLDTSDRHRLLTEWNQTAAEYPRERCIHELFEAQAARTPERPAVRCGEQAYSYRELNERANRLAHHLRDLGAGPDARVGLCLERSAEMIVALLAILKAGAAYVPLSGDNPKARLAQQTAGAVVLLTEKKLLAQMPEFDGPILCVDSDEGRWSGAAASNPETAAGPENLVYVIYTSGSTGVPKGVAVRHRNLVNYATFIARQLEAESASGGLHFATVSTLSADLGNTCIYPSLISGGCLHVIPFETAADSRQFGDYAARHPIDVLKIVPSHLTALLDAGGGRELLPRRYLITGGEALSGQLLEKVRGLGAGCRIINHYGPTETTVGSVMLPLADDYTMPSGHTIPIGRPMANTQIYILDAAGEPVPVGVAGELFIAGDGVTAGYLNQPAATAERFVANPFGNGTDKMYRTGDLARYQPDGKVEFLGRADDQVKIRGFRIELGEVEAALAQHPGVRQAVVVAGADQRGDKRLVGYIVGQRDRELKSEELRSYLASQLPDYMIPAALVLLPKLPLNANGKINRQALPEPETVQSAAQTYVAPRTGTEEAVAGIWREVFRREQVGIEDNFFDIGGHSLLATQVMSRVRDHFRVDLVMRCLFEQPTIRGLSELVDAAQEAGGDIGAAEILPVARENYRLQR